MSWLNGYSASDIKDMVEDACRAFYNMAITESELRTALGRLGLNATDIEDKVEENRP